MRLGCIAILFCFFSALHAESLGVYGSIYSIAEPDMLSMIQTKLQKMKQSGKLAEMEQEVKKRVAKHAVRPNAVKGVGPVTKNRTFYFTPKITLEHNIYDATGKLLFPAGTSVNILDSATVKKINPYATIPNFNETLLFINADDEAQVRWANKQAALASQVKIILVKGNLVTTSNQLGRIYFDQHGALCHHFGIKGVPAKLTRDGTKLKITEFSESGL